MLEKSLFEEYKNYTFIPAAIPCSLIILIVTIFGLISNIFLILITIFSNTLRSTTNFLIAFQSFFDILHLLSHFYLVFVFFSGKNFDRLIDCFYIQIVPISGVNIGIALIFFTAFDRFFSFFSHFHKNINKKVYLTIILLFCCSYNFYILVISYFSASESSLTMVCCIITEAMHGKPRNIWSFSVASLVCLSIIFYGIIKIMFSIHCGASETVKALNKSLLVICSTIFFSWFLTSITMLVFSSIDLPIEIQFFVPLYIGITINASVGVNLHILTRFSTDYRIAARKFFFRTFGLKTFESPVKIRTSVVNPSFA